MNEQDTTRRDIRQKIVENGKYELLNENREGASAYSFVARHIPLDKKVFLKIYDVCSNAEDKVIFNEARTIQDAHSNKSHGRCYLVDIIDTDKLDLDKILIAMEYVEGKSLLSHIVASPFRLMTAIEIIKGVLHGLSCLHNSLLVHRDIKPANVMLDISENSPVPKLTDFGSVARINKASDFTTASKHSALYVPPEGWNEPSEYGIASDIYQVGMVFYELLNGALPYCSESWLDNDAKKQLKQDTCNFSDLESFDRDQMVNQSIARRSRKRMLLSAIPEKAYLDRTIKAIYNKATNPDPSQRFTSTIEMISSLSPLSYPNWKYENGVYYADGWKECDWKIEQQKKRSGSMFTVSRKSNTSSLRKWLDDPCIRSAFKKVKSGCKQ